MNSKEEIQNAKGMIIWAISQVMAFSCCRSIFFFFCPGLWTLHPQGDSMLLSENREWPFIYLCSFYYAKALCHCSFCLFLDWNYKYVLMIMLHIVMEMMRPQVRYLHPLIIIPTMEKSGQLGSPSNIEEVQELGRYQSWPGHQSRPAQRTQCLL